MNTLVWFAQNRHRLTTEQQLVGDERMLAAERMMWINVWALDVLTLVHGGEFTEAMALGLKGPREVHMRDSVNVSYVRTRQDAAPGVQWLMDCAWMSIQRLSEAKLRAFEATQRALAAKWSAWLSPPPSHISGRAAHA